MHVVLDASIVIEQGYGASRRLRALLSVATAAGFTVYVPKPVLEETIAKYPRTLKELSKKARKPVSELWRLLGRESPNPIEGLDTAKETDALKNRLSDQLTKSFSVVLDYPSTSHESLVRRATLRRRPFNQNGSGYRDALVWDSVIELALKVEDNIVLVSTDGDFSDGQGSLHKDLVEDLISKGIPKDRVTLSTGMNSLVEDYIRPVLGTVPWESSLQSIAKKGWNLEDSISLIVYESCSGDEFDPQELGLRPEYESPSLDVVQGVSGLNVVDTRNLPNDQLLVRIEADLDCSFLVLVYKPDWYVIEDSALHLWDFEWSDHYLSAGINVSMHCEMDLLLRSSDSELPKIEDVAVKLFPKYS